MVGMADKMENFDFKNTILKNKISSWSFLEVKFIVQGFEVAQET